MKKSKLKLERTTVQQMSRADLGQVNGGSIGISCIACNPTDASCPAPSGNVKCQYTILCPIGTIGC